MRFSTMCALIILGTVWAADSAAAEVPLATFDRVTDAACRSGSDVRRCCGWRAPSRRDRWGFGISLYGWLASTDGEIWADGESRDFSMSFEQALEKTKGGLQGYAEARKGKWFFALDATYANLGDDVEGPLGFVNLEAEVIQWIVDARIGYRVGQWVLSRRLGGAGTKPCRTLDLYLFTGVRYYRTDLTIDLESRGGLITRQAESTDEKLDGLLGLRVRADLGCRWSLDVRGDLGVLSGGFDFDDYSWETAAYLGFALTRHWIVYAGYRAQGQTRLTGEGATKAGQDLVVHGPLLGVGFVF